MLLVGEIVQIYFICLEEGFFLHLLHSYDLDLALQAYSLVDVEA